MEKYPAPSQPPLDDIVAKILERAGMKAADWPLSAADVADGLVGAGVVDVHDRLARLASLRLRGWLVEGD